MSFSRKKLPSSLAPWWRFWDRHPLRVYDGGFWAVYHELPRGCFHLRSIDKKGTVRKSGPFAFLDDAIHAATKIKNVDNLTITAQGFVGVTKRARP